MIRIVEDVGERISEHSQRFVESNPMLLDVLCSLLRIPLKLGSHLTDPSLPRSIDSRCLARATLTTHPQGALSAAPEIPPARAQQRLRWVLLLTIGALHCWFSNLASVASIPDLST